jgi:hypothetical protein
MATKRRKHEINKQKETSTQESIKNGLKEIEKEVSLKTKPTFDKNSKVLPTFPLRRY